MLGDRSDWTRTCGMPSASILIPSALCMMLLVLPQSAARISSPLPRSTFLARFLIFTRLVCPYRYNKARIDIFQAITTVWDSVITNQIISQGDMSNFVQSFAERKDTTDEKTIKLILDSITFVLGLGSAVVWNDSELIPIEASITALLTNILLKSSKRPRSSHVSIPDYPQDYQLIKEKNT